METNNEGMTWPQWFRATFPNSPKTMTKAEQDKLRKAWRNGEDPSEWRLYHAQQKGTL